MPAAASALGVELRAHQRASVEALLRGEDTLLVSPTGSGKSYVFWTAGLALGGVTVIVSPLRALMADQVRRATELGLRAWKWNSDVGAGEKRLIERDVARGVWGFFYTTPESLRTDRVRDLLRGRVALAAVDEAHCTIRENSYRAEYARLGAWIDDLQPRGPRFACTATLPLADRTALVESLRLDSPARVVLPVARADVEFSTDHARSTRDVGTVLRGGGAGIVFCATVRVAETLAEELRSLGYGVGAYHGRLKDEERRRVQDAWMDGATQAVVATDAFGLGIDKADVRWTCAYDPPKSIEDWVQQFGRAGRDGEGAVAHACWGYGADEGVESRRFLVQSSYPRPNAMRRVWESLPAGGEWTDRSFSAVCVAALGRNGKYGAAQVKSRLHGWSLIETRGRGRSAYYRRVGDFEATDLDPYIEERNRALARYRRMTAMTEVRGENIAPEIDAYFGD